jgi:hypothetical protein
MKQQTGSRTKQNHTMEIFLPAFNYSRKQYWKRQLIDILAYVIVYAMLTLMRMVFKVQHWQIGVLFVIA